MQLHRLPADSALNLDPGTWVRISTMPRTVEEVLAAARARMDAEDAYECWLRGEPVPMMRHPRRKLRRLLFGRR